MDAQALAQEKGDGALLSDREERLALVVTQGTLDRHYALDALRSLPADDVEVDLQRPVPSRGILLEGDRRTGAEAGQEKIEGRRSLGVLAGGAGFVGDQRE